MNQYNLAPIDELFAAEYVNHFAPPSSPKGPQLEKLLAQSFFHAFPDGHMVLENLVAEGDRVACRYVYSATHQGEFMGIPATGKPFSIGGISIFRLTNGQSAEDWPSIDWLGFMQQIGVVPASGQ